MININTYTDTENNVFDNLINRIDKPINQLTSKQMAQRSAILLEDGLDLQTTPTPQDTSWPKNPPKQTVITQKTNSLKPINLTPFEFHNTPSDVLGTAELKVYKDTGTKQLRTMQTIEQVNTDHYCSTNTKHTYASECYPEEPSDNLINAKVDDTDNNEGLTERLNRLSGSKYNGNVDKSTLSVLDHQPTVYEWDKLNSKEATKTIAVQPNKNHAVKKRSSINLNIFIISLLFCIILVGIDLLIFRYPMDAFIWVCISIIGGYLSNVLIVLDCKKRNKKLNIMVVWGFIMCLCTAVLCFYIGYVTDDLLANCIKGFMGFVPWSVLWAGWLILRK